MKLLFLILAKLIVLAAYGCMLLMFVMFADIVHTPWYSMVVIFFLTLLAAQGGTKDIALFILKKPLLKRPLCQYWLPASSAAANPVKRDKEPGINGFLR